MSIPLRLARIRPTRLRFIRTSLAIITAAVPAVFGTLGYNLSPLWYWGIAAMVFPGILYSLFRRAVPLADARVQARRRWKSHGPSVERVPYTQFEKYREDYGDYTRDNTRGYVDDRTWSDLGMDEIHDRIDVSFTIAGRNELYRILRHALPPETSLAERGELMRLLTEDEARRTEIAQVLARVGEERDADPAVLLWGESVKTDDLFPVFIAMSGFSVASILIKAFGNTTLGIVAIIVAFFSNMWVYYRKARHVSVYVPALRVLSRMIAAARDIPWYDLPELRSHTRGARRAFGWLLTGAPSPSPTFSGDITEVVLLYVKIFFQIDLIAYNRIIRTMSANRESFRKLYAGLGTVDALYSLASYRARRKRSCDAELAETVNDEIELEGAYHPLIARAVPNSVALHRPGAIVTGTNMAGKSTFLRTVGICVLFAQTAGYTFASRYRAPRFRVMSSIEKHDDLAEGKSFYYDEAERIYRMIEEVGSEVPALLLIDELLSGTNSLERESASIAILHYLAARPALTIAATHDVAIARGVSEEYALHYFTDDADETGLTFDYKIHEGVVETRNAIKLLRLIGYPEDVITSALESTQGL